MVVMMLMILVLFLRWFELGSMMCLLRVVLLLKRCLVISLLRMVMFVGLFGWNLWLVMMGILRVEKYLFEMV